MKDYKRGNHCVHKLYYRMVFVTKFRKQFITGELARYMLNSTKRLLEIKEGTLIFGEAGADFLSLVVSLPPNCCLSDVVRSIKTQLSKEVRVLFPGVVEQYLGDKLPMWSPNYLIATSGEISEEEIAQYISSQPTTKQSCGRKKKE